MMPVIADYTFKMFLTFYILQAEPPKCCGALGNLPPTLPLDGSECINNALISALKKLTQWECVNAFKKLMLRQL